MRLVFEQKAWELGSNVEHIDRKRFVKSVKKNLVSLVMMRHDFGVFLDPGLPIYASIANYIQE